MVGDKSGDRETTQSVTLVLEEDNGGLYNSGSTGETGGKKKGRRIELYFGGTIVSRICFNHERDDTIVT